MYNAPKIEKKWQKIWAESSLFQINIKKAKKKFYCLVMFPYPSGDKLHVGHWYNFGPADSYAHFIRMKGYTVFEPIGYDAFGLPAENYAIKTGIHPEKTTKRNIAYMRRQLHQMGAMYDWSKEINTSSKEYYKWTQWIFLQLYKKGLAYRKNAPVNWCPSCQTVLANEQVQEGRCERCGSEVTKKDLTQWFFKIRDYAEQLLDFSQCDWPEKTKIAQQNWIGKSIGSEIKFAIVDSNNTIKVFTTRADTLFGATYMVLAPEYPLTLKITNKENLRNVKQYIEKAKKISDIERSSEVRDKTGVFTGAYAVNPISNEKIPIWIADYVLIHYGTGAVMAVPAHDERDYEFAKKYQLEIREVIKPMHGQSTLKKSAYTEYGILVNSKEFSGQSSEQAKTLITEKLKKQNEGDFKINYKLRDWLISRQRYWGAPIPIIYCDQCGEIPVPIKNLPVELPSKVDFNPKGDGKSPLAHVPKFVNAKCPKCGKKAKRETDTMDTFVCSSWYFLRYPSANIQSKALNTALTAKWLPVDMYIGGNEHACMHLLYARFIHKVLRDLGSYPHSEPFNRLVHQGTITKDGAKMSKSRGNVVSPDEFVKQYGSDVFRMYLMFMGPFTEGGDWSDKGITGIARFVQRFYQLIEKQNPVQNAEKLAVILNKTIKSVTEDIELLHFNTAISALMEFTNQAVDTGIDEKSKKEVVKLIAPLAPHLGEELWQILHQRFSIFNAKWPTFDEKLTKDVIVNLPIQINGKLRGVLQIKRDENQQIIISKAKEVENIKKHLYEKHIIKEIYIPNKILNIIVK